MNIHYENFWTLEFITYAEEPENTFHNEEENHFKLIRKDTLDKICSQKCLFLIAKTMFQIFKKPKKRWNPQ